MRTRVGRSWSAGLLAAVLIGAAVSAAPTARAETTAVAQGEVVFPAPDTQMGYDTFHLKSVAPDGATRTLTPATEDRKHEVPAWSPDARWLAYREVGPGVRRAMVIAADGTRSQVLAEGVSPPRWTPDGRHIVFTQSTPSGSVVVVLDVAEDASGLVLGGRRSYPLPRAAGPVEVSPDGRTLLFTMTRNRYASVSRAGDLWRMNIDGSALRPVSRSVNVWTEPGRTFAWSPDGDRVAFLGFDGLYEDFTVGHVVNLDGTRQRPLREPWGCSDTGIAWAPHGDYLTVTSECDHVEVFSPEGALLARLRVDLSMMGPPVFAPDASAVYATAEGLQGQRAVYRIPMDGGEPEQVTGDGHYPKGALAIADPERVHPVVVPPPGPPDPPAPPPPPYYRPAPPAALDHACPAAEMPPSRFVDIARTVHREAVDCLAWWQVAGGRSSRRFAPTDPILRGDMAALLMALARAGGRPLPVTTQDAFDDDDGSRHEGAINRLAAAGVVSGVGGRRFDPHGTVRRDQMATFVVRTYAFIRGHALPAPHDDHFADDDSSPHEATINAAAAAGLVAGVARDRYAPGALERRETAATRVARVLDALVEQAWAHPPREGLARIGVVTDGDTILADRLDDMTDKPVRVRLVGLQAMERRQCNAMDAALNLHYLIGYRTVRLSSAKSESIGRDDRPLRFVNVYDLQDERWIDASDEMLRRGVALWFPSTKEPGNNDRHRAAVRAGVRTGKYLWDTDRCGGGPQQAARLRMRLQWDAPGADHTNLNGEWVRITNAGTTAVNVSGWKVRTAFLRSPHEFGARTIIPGGKTLTLRVGSGRDSRLTKHWGAQRPMFRNVQVGRPNQAGDGAYLLDPDGDIRAHVLYP